MANNPNIKRIDIHTQDNVDGAYDFLNDRITSDNTFHRFQALVVRGLISPFEELNQMQAIDSGATPRDIMEGVTGIAAGLANGVASVLMGYNGESPEAQMMMLKGLLNQLKTTLSESEGTQKTGMYMGHVLEMGEPVFQACERMLEGLKHDA